MGSEGIAALSFFSGLAKAPCLLENLQLRGAPGRWPIETHLYTCARSIFGVVVFFNFVGCMFSLCHVS